ncbi:uncharacterized protein [Palaemon carinicauda]|uniref:uncharacterized protein n=1 Tax=Palaemon carinicauda TaxID=392227 RepID=UPI0035B58BF7
MKKPPENRLLLRTLVILVINGVLTYGAPPVDSKQSVTYIESFRRQYFIAPKLTFDPSNATHVLPGLNSCDCQTSCFARSPKDCQAWSFVRTSRQGPQDVGECRLIDSGPETTDLLPDENALYYFRKSSVLGTYSWQDDGLLYVTLNDTYYIDPAKERCNRIPGHRLIIVKSMKTFNFFANLWKYGDKSYWLTDLRKTPSGRFEWGDGSDSSVTQGLVNANGGELSNIFVSYAQRIDDASDSRDGPFWILCQANPLGIDW